MALMVVIEILHKKLIKDILSICVENYFPFIGNIYLDAIFSCLESHLDNRPLASKLYCIIKDHVKGVLQ